MGMISPRRRRGAGRCKGMENVSVGGVDYVMCSAEGATVYQPRPTA